MHFLNLFRLGFRLTVLGVASLWMGACGYDDEATVTGPQGILASGAYHSVFYGDACRGGGKLNFCSSENLTELLELSSEDPNVVDIIPAEEHPLYPLTSGDYFLLGKTPGKTTLTFRGKFDDGSKRSAETEVTVKAIERMDIAVRCDGEEKGDQLLVPVNERGTFDVQLFAGKDELVGWLPRAVTADGLEDPGASNNANHRIWQAPAKAGSQTVKSEWVNGTVGRLTAFDYEQVTAISVENRNDYRPVSIVTEGTLYVDTKVTIDAQTPCNSLPLEFHTETPKICAGPEGESTWPGENHYGGFAKLYAEGICKLGFSVPGGPILARESFTVFKVKPTPEGLSLPGFGNYCEMEGSTACDYSSDGIGLCKNNRWVEDGYCDRNEVCDFVADTSKGCVKGGPCAQCRGFN